LWFSPPCLLVFIPKSFFFTSSVSVVKKETDRTYLHAYTHTTVEEEEGRQERGSGVWSGESVTIGSEAIGYTVVGIGTSVLIRATTPPP
jgi:hypothetical protein